MIKPMPPLPEPFMTLLSETVRQAWAEQMHSYARAYAEQETAALQALPKPQIELVNDSFAIDWLTNRAELHPLTANLVVRFARALAQKLAAAEKKYGYSDGWRSDEWEAECRARLREHIEKGDPRDVAAYCAFMWHHAWSTSLDAAIAQSKDTWTKA